jgi:hypothetical protein
MIVKENISNFERGRDPIRAMDIGKYSSVRILETLTRLMKKFRKDLSGFKIRMSLDHITSSPEDCYILSFVGFGNLIFVNPRDYPNGIEWPNELKWPPGFSYHGYDYGKHIPEYFGLDEEKAFNFMMNKIKNYKMNEDINFERGLDPMQSMNIGKKHKIEKWIDNIEEITNYTINPDFSIDLFDPLHLMERSDLFPEGRFPEYIRFNSSSDFDVDDCGLVSLEGCPIHVNGYFSCQLNELETLEGSPKEVETHYYCIGNPGEFTEEEVRKYCNVRKDIQAEDSINND